MSENGYDAEAAAEAFEQIWQEFVECLRTRDTQRALALFDDDVIWFGSVPYENARGVEELRRFMDEDLFKRAFTVEWQWERPVMAGSGDLAWFVAPTTAIVHYEDRSDSLAYRMSGVLQRGADGRWRVRMFNGAEPAEARPGS